MIYLLPSLLYKKYLKVFFITFFFLQFYQLHSQELNSNSDFFKTVSYGANSSDIDHPIPI